VESGFLLSLVQLAGMAAGVAFGAVADRAGPRRSMVAGLSLLGLASLLGGTMSSVAALMLLRAVEGFGFLLVVLPAPGLLRGIVAPLRLSLMLGVWGTYMPSATALALLAGPVWIEALGWRTWWWLLGGLSVAMALWLARAVAPQRPAPLVAAAAPRLTLLRRTLSVGGPWLVAITFGMYSAQWLAVIGFLPTIVAQAGLSGAATGVLTAFVAAANMLGNLAAGRLLHRGVAPGRLLAAGFVTMALAAAAAFAGAAGAGLPPELRYMAVVAFSAIGGLIPATLFTLAVRVAPGVDTLSTTVGWLQQWSAFGQFAGPPLVAWVAGRLGGWHGTWIATGAMALLGLALGASLARRCRA
jgi:MFS family permease